MTTHRFALALLLTACTGWFVLGPDHGPSLAAQERGAQDKDKEKAPPPVPDLRELMAKPRNEMAAVARWYDADHSALGRKYPLAMSPTRHDRMKRFYAGWSAALNGLDADKLSESARAELTKLKDSVTRDAREVESQARAQTEVAPLLPFAPTVIGLEEARRRMEPIDSAKAAGLLTNVTKQIRAARKSVEEGDEKDRPAKALAGRAADTVNGLRAALKSWFGFYNGYDPAFTWWLAEPYREADEALGAYATALRKRADDKAVEDKKTDEKKADPDKDGQCAAAVDTADVPDLRQLITAPQSELQPVIARYQADQRGMSRVAAAGLPVPRRTPERSARMAKFHTDWADALGKLDYDALSVAGRVDYHLLKTHIGHELRRIELQPKGRGDGKDDRPMRPRAPDAIEGRPIGRDAVLAELAGEMIALSPEELIDVSEREYAWCEAEMKKASREMGFGDDWKKAVEKVKTLHVPPGGQPELIRSLAVEAVDYLRKHDLVTVPPVAAEVWRMEMMTPQRQLVNPFFTGGEVISVSYPTNTMSHEAKLQSMRGNNPHFSKATVHHELIPGHHLQGYMTGRYATHRGPFATAFWGEGWAVYWEMVLYDRGFPKSAEDRVGFLFWRMHRCARVVFSLNFHLGKMTAKECVDYLVAKVGHEPDNAAAEVRRSFAGGYGPLYQCAYLVGAMQFRALRREVVDTGKLTDRDFHDAILKEGRLPVEMVRALVTGQKLARDFKPGWKFDGGKAALQ